VIDGTTLSVNMAIYVSNVLIRKASITLEANIRAHKLQYL